MTLNLAMSLTRPIPPILTRIDDESLGDLIFICGTCIQPLRIQCILQYFTEYSTTGRPSQNMFCHQTIRLIDTLNDPHWKDEPIELEDDSS
jgi:hypothetical protein